MAAAAKKPTQDKNPPEPAVPYQVGEMFTYRLAGRDVVQINRRRGDARDKMRKHQEAKTGVQIHIGSKAEEGDELPLMITKVHNDGKVNGRVFLDGNDDLWLSKIIEGEGAGEFFRREDD